MFASFPPSRPIVFLSSPAFTSLECLVKKLNDPNLLISPITWLSCEKVKWSQQPDSSHLDTCTTNSDFVQCHLPSCLDQYLGVIPDSLFPHAPHLIHREMLLALVLKSIQNPDSSCFLLPSHQWPAVLSCLESMLPSLKVSLCPHFHSLFSSKHTEKDFN